MTHSPPPGLIPDQLLSNIKKGDCVLFLGADLPLGYDGAPLSRPELAAALAAKYGLPPDRPWPETAQAYLSQFSGDRNGLIRFVAGHGSGPKVQAGPLHKAIARLGFRAIVTAWYDQLLEQSLEQAGYRVNRVVRDVQLPYAGEGEREAILVKLYGCLSDPESLVLDPWDHEELMDRLSRKLELVTAFCSLRPPLFVGFDLLDRLPMRLYVRASTNLAQHMRRAYTVWPQPLEAVRAAWREKNVQFSRAEATAFLTALADQLPVAGPAERRAIRVQRPPYKFLDYYEPADVDIFCGRDTESQIVTRLALSHRLLTLFGPSGAGKTSLLLAGVLPRLAAEGYHHVYVRALDDPLPALRKAIAGRAGRTGWQVGADLAAFLPAMLAVEDKLVVVLDQFEELFLRVGSRRRATFFAELATALARPAREVRFIFSLREDYLALLDEARPNLPDIFGNSFRLATLERGSARLAITEPAARAGVGVEAALVDALVGAEGQGSRGVEERGSGGAGERGSRGAGERGSRGAGDLVEADGYVPPAALQIVLDRLYREALPPDYDPGAPPPPGLTLSLAAYRAIRHPAGVGEAAGELCGAEAILAGYIDQGLARLAEPALGEAILKVMVTSQATKAALSQAEMVALLDEAGLVQAEDPADRRLVEQTRLGLERVRLLRSFEREGLALYELAHDHLAAAVARRLSEAELGARLARELLRREMDNWRGAGLLIRPEVLAMIHERRADLRRLNREELALLFRSALAAGYEVLYWFERARTGGVAVDDIALAGLQEVDFRVRAAAVVALGQLGARFVEAITGMLNDDYPQVRAAAIAALERVAPEGTWRQALRHECYVPAGEFIMGDDGPESEYRDRKVPAHEVFVNAFYAGKYPVTNAEYRRYMDDRGRAFEIPAGKDKHPVVGVSWYDANDYAHWAGMRLLTEAEWEKAASWAEEQGGRGAGGRKRRYPWGDEFDAGKCNTQEGGAGGTTPVGQYSPWGDSPYGCVDMAGNVWEWTGSLYRDYPYRPDDGREDFASSDARVLRGGAFDDFGAPSARCAARDRFNPYGRDWSDGFRVGWGGGGSL